MQIGIVNVGATEPLLRLLSTEQESNMQHHMAAFAIYALSESREVVPELIASGTLEEIAALDTSAMEASPRDCVKKTAARIEAHVALQVRESRAGELRH